MNERPHQQKKTIGISTKSELYTTINEERILQCGASGQRSTDQIHYNTVCHQLLYFQIVCSKIKLTRNLQTPQKSKQPNDRFHWTDACNGNNKEKQRKRLAFFNNQNSNITLICISLDATAEKQQCNT